MIKIGLISDTHSYWDDKFSLHFSDCDEIWHAGDIGSEELSSQFESLGKKFRAVYGNIDNHKIRSFYPESLRFSLENVDVLITHIGGYPGKYIPAIKNILNIKPPQLFICGHSHILKVIYDKSHNMLCVNPGAAGKYGFHKVRTLVKFVIDNGNIKDMEIIELAD